MATVIKTLVSKKKKRHTEGEFNLDLSYITDQVIAMGFPANRLEGIYRNNIDDVVKFLDKKHMDKYMVYNLCRERSYGAEKFHSRVQVYPFEDHCPPSMWLIPRFCEAVHEWLAKGPLFVAAVHCKAGKGRTGLMICCYLLHASHNPWDWQQKFLRPNPRPFSADQVLELYAKLRTLNNEGVTIPSQRRYVHYYEYQLDHGVKTCDEVPLQLLSCKLHGGLPAVGNSGSCSIYMRIHTQSMLAEDIESHAAHTTQARSGGESSVHLVGVSAVQEVRRGDFETVLLPTDDSAPLIIAGDVRVTLYHKHKMKKKEKLFQFWFNTYFVANQCRSCCSANESSQLNEHTSLLHPNGYMIESEAAVSGCVISCHQPLPSSSIIYPEDTSQQLTLTLAKHQLDKAVKDKIHKIFPASFKVTLTFERADKEDWVRAAERAQRRTSTNPDVFSDLVHDEDSDDLEIDSDPPSPRIFEQSEVVDEITCTKL